MDAVAGGEILRFEGFRLDRQARVLFRRDAAGAFVPIAIGSRAFEVLDLLVGRAGDLVSRDEFMAVVWPATAVEDTNLNMQVAALRRVLDEGRAEGSCIQTIPGRGYRFVAPVTRVEPAAPPAPTPPSGNDSGAPIAENGQLRGLEAASPLGDKPPPAASPRHYRVPAGIIGTVVLALGLVAAVAGWNWRSLWSGEARPVPRLSIAVLPFTNLSDDREQQYFADGVTEDLTTDLSRLAEMLVISRNSAFTYKAKTVNAKQVGRELGVRYTLEGSVQRSGSQVRVNVQLIDAETDAHLWAERFDRDIGDLFALQNEITGRIANTLSIEVVGREAARATDSPDALDYIFRGRAARLKPNSRNVFAEAISMYERALALDPRSAEAQSLLAIVLADRVLDQMTDSAAAGIARADGLVGQALAASPRSATVHFAKGEVLRAQGRFQEAIPEYETVLAFNRNSAGAFFSLGQCKLMTGSIEQVIPLEEQAIRLSPRDPQIAVRYHIIGQVHLLQSRTTEAILWLEKARSANPEFPYVHAWLASAYGLKGETERAAAELAEARRLRGEGSYASVARIAAAASGYWGVPQIRALWETTYLAGLQNAGVPEE